MTLDTAVINILHQYAKVYNNFDSKGKRQLDLSASLVAMNRDRQHIYLLIYDAFKIKYNDDRYEKQRRLTLE